MPDTVTRRRRRGRCGISSCCNATRSMEVSEGLIGNKCLPNLAVDKKPYLEQLQSSLVAGTCITIQGLIKPDCPRFSVNLCCGTEPNCDIALHINPRLSLRHVVRNTRLHGQWLEEETTSVQRFNLDRGSPFQMQIYATHNVFYISINGKHHSAFVFRIPIQRVSALQIDGGVEIYDVGYGKLHYYPPRRPDNPLYEVPTVDGIATPQALESPLTASFPEGFQENWQLEVYGRIKLLPSTFYINLQKGTDLCPHPLIYLHLNPRFSTAFGRDVLVRNAWVGDNWGPEERISGFPFLPGAAFALSIQRLHDYFSVWINGVLTGEFRFRCPVDEIDGLHIQGDVILKGVCLRKRLDTKCFSNSTFNIMGLEE